MEGDTENSALYPRLEKLSLALLCVGIYINHFPHNSRSCPLRSQSSTYIDRASQVISASPSPLAKVSPATPCTVLTYLRTATAVQPALNTASFLCPPPVQANQPTFNASPHFMLNGSLAGPRSSSHMYLASLERGQEDKTKIPRRPVY